MIAITVHAKNPKAFLRSETGKRLVRALEEAAQKKALVAAASPDPCSLIPDPSTPEAS
jgi:hypothetical protein